MAHRIRTSCPLSRAGCPLVQPELGARGAEPRRDRSGQRPRPGQGPDPRGGPLRQPRPRRASGGSPTGNHVLTDGIDDSAIAGRDLPEGTTLGPLRRRRRVDQRDRDPLPRRGNGGRRSAETTRRSGSAKRPRSDLSRDRRRGPPRSIPVAAGHVSGILPQARRAAPGRVPADVSDVGAYWFEEELTRDAAEVGDEWCEDYPGSGNDLTSPNETAQRFSDYLA